MKRTKTARGFDLIKFTDRYGAKCSIQKSSLASEHAIWLGVDDAEPKVMASKASQFNINTDETSGWIPYPIPEDVLLTTRMHLTINEVRKLIPILQKFVETGEI